MSWQEIDTSVKPDVQQELGAQQPQTLDDYRMPAPLPAIDRAAAATAILNFGFPSLDFSDHNESAAVGPAAARAQEVAAQDGPPAVGQRSPANGQNGDNVLNPIIEKDVSQAAYALLNSLGAPMGKHADAIAQVLQGALATGGERLLRAYTEQISSRWPQPGLD